MDYGICLFTCRSLEMNLNVYRLDEEVHPFFSVVEIAKILRLELSKCETYSKVGDHTHILYDENGIEFVVVDGIAAKEICDMSNSKYRHILGHITSSIDVRSAGVMQFPYIVRSVKRVEEPRDKKLERLLKEKEAENKALKQETLDKAEYVSIPRVAAAQSKGLEEYSVKALELASKDKKLFPKLIQDPKFPKNGKSYHEDIWLEVYGVDIRKLLMRKFIPGEKG